MARGSVSLEDYLEDKIKSYMKINKIMKSYLPFLNMRKFLKILKI